MYEAAFFQLLGKIGEGIQLSTTDLCQQRAKFLGGTVHSNAWITAAKVKAELLTKAIPQTDLHRKEHFFTVLQPRDATLFTLVSPLQRLGQIPLPPQPIPPLFPRLSTTLPMMDLLVELRCAFRPTESSSTYSIFLLPFLYLLCSPSFCFLYTIYF